jgi:hypothetical protein
MRRDFGWESPARAYIDLYRALVAATERATSEASTTQEPVPARLEPVAA